MNSILLLLATFMVSRLSGPHRHEQHLEFPQQQSSQETVLPLKTLSYHLESRIKYRYARTMVSSKIYNPCSRESQEAVFSVVLPETAFISSFIMNIDGIAYEGFVKDKIHAKHNFPKSIPKKHSWYEHVLKVKDSNRFTISVILEPLKTAIFNLTYEGLLRRNLGRYNHVLNLDPGEVVEDLVVSIEVKETSSISTFFISPLTISNGEDWDLKEDDTNLEFEIKMVSQQNAVAWLSPTTQQQKDVSIGGIKGQFALYYDLERETDMEVVIDVGYFARFYSRFFAHYFAPINLRPLQKHVIFVMDTSVSEGGSKLMQIKKAMEIILGDFSPMDYFSLISYSDTAQIWRLNSTTHENSSDVDENVLKNAVLKAKHENVLRAMNIIEELQESGLNDLSKALKLAFMISHGAKQRLQRISNSIVKTVYTQPTIVLLTDGIPQAGENSTQKMFKRTRRWNAKTNAAIFSLAIGDKANFDFLRRICQDNSGFALRLHGNYNIENQLTDFYHKVSSPVMSDVTFEYNMHVNSTSLTSTYFGTFFSGSEIVVAGIFTEIGLNFGYSVSGRTVHAIKHYFPQKTTPVSDHGIENTPGTLERIWAYLTIQKMLDGNCMCGKKQEATETALKYSFVTPVTSMIVVRPDGRWMRAVVEPADKAKLNDKGGDGIKYSQTHH